MGQIRKSESYKTKAESKPIIIHSSATVVIICSIGIIWGMTVWGMTAWLAFASLTGEARWGWIGLLTGVIPATYILYATRNINQIKSQEVNNGKRI